MKVARLSSTAKIPTRKNSTDAGLDLYSNITTRIPAHSMKIIGTGITMEIPKGHVGLIWPKGSSGHLIGAGVVDALYQGELLVKIYNTFHTDLYIMSGEAIAQILIQPVVTNTVKELSLDEIHQIESLRGKSGGINEELQA